MLVNAEAVVKGTNFNGIYDSHPGNNSASVDIICYREVVPSSNTSMDAMALTYCEENRIPGWSHPFLLAQILANVKLSFH